MEHRWIGVRVAARDFHGLKVSRSPFLQGEVFGSQKLSCSFKANVGFLQNFDVYKDSMHVTGFYSKENPTHHGGSQHKHTHTVWVRSSILQALDALWI